MSLETPAMEVVGLIQRWRDQVRREGKERREQGLRLNLFLLKIKNKKIVTWWVRIGWSKTRS